MRTLQVLAPYGDQRETVAYKLFGPNAALTALDTTTPLATIPVRARRRQPSHHGQRHHSAPHHAITEYAGQHGARHHSQPFHHELDSLSVPSLDRYEYGTSIPFALAAIDRWGNESAAPNEGGAFINSAPAMVRSAVLSESAGVFTMSITDEVA